MAFEYSDNINDWMEDMESIMKDVVKDFGNVQIHLKEYSDHELLLHFGLLKNHSTELKEITQAFGKQWKKKYKKVAKIIEKAEDAIAKIYSVAQMMDDFNTLKNMQPTVKVVGGGLSTPVEEANNIIGEALKEFKK